MSQVNARGFLFVLVFHSSLANIAGWNAVSAQETVRDNPSPAATAEVKSQDTAVRGLAALRAEAEAELDKEYSRNHHEVVLSLYREIVKHPENSGQKLIQDLINAGDGLNDGEDGYWEQFIELCEVAVKSHPNDWRVRLAVTGDEDYGWDEHYIRWESAGHKVGDQIYRGYDDESEWSFDARDRVRHLQMLLEAVEIVSRDSFATAREKGDIYNSLANTLYYFPSSTPASLSVLTDINRLPDPSMKDESWYESEQSVPIKLDEKGQPVGFRLPNSWNEAKSDRERWHWALEQAAQADPERRSQLELQWIAHVDEMVGISDSFPERSDIVNPGRSASSNKPAKRFSKADIRALPDSDTFIQTANGPKRVTLDDEINPFVLLQRIIDRKDADELVDAMRAMTQLRITRHQLSKVANQLDGYVNDLNGVLRDLPFNTTPNVFRSGRKQMNAVIDQLLSHRVSIKPRNESEPIETNGSQWKSHSLELSFRNATSTTFRLMPVDLEKIIETKLAGAFPAPEEPNAQSDPRQYILSILLTGVGRLTDVHREGLIKEQLIGPVAKEWTVALKPLPEHELTSEEIDVQVDDPSKLWLLTAGNGDTIDDSWLLWQAPAEFVIKPMKDKSHVGFLADRLTGKGIGNTEIDVCHFEEKMFQKSWKEFGTTLSTDENGLFRIPKGKTLNGLMVCRKDGHVLALGKIFDRTEHFGRDPVQTDLQMQLEQEPRAFIVTDRSIYRPGDTVRFHFWIRKAFGELSLIPDLAECSVTITDISEYSESETFFAKGQHDARKGFTSEWKIPIDVKLGDYQLEPRISGLRLSQSSSFRIEEYRRPEFRVTVTTTGHSAATDQQEITVEARYLFGKPLPSGSVKWKLIYQDEPEMQYPVERWDGLYGNGYAWDFAAASRPQMHLRGLGGRGGGMGFFSIPPNGGNSRLASSESETGERRLIMSGKSVLDADGKCVFQLNSVSKLLDRGSSR